MNELALFDFQNHPVRILRCNDNEPLFIAKDVANALGYVWKGISTIPHVPPEWRGVQSVQTPSGMQEMLTLSEPGLYFFLGRSDKPAALPFQKWLAGEVLPAIRKAGTYKIRKVGEAMPESAMSVAPRLRQKLLQDAIQLARLDGADSAAALGWFDRLCRMYSGNGKTMEQLFDDFAASCLENDPGAKTRFADIYAALSAWWPISGNGAMPGTKTLANWLSMFYERKKSSVAIYSGVKLQGNRMNVTPRAGLVEPPADILHPNLPACV